jgi:Oxidoreductase family, NAD-binding Rossmann fold
MDFIVVGIRFWGREWCKLLKKQSVASVVATVDLSEAAAKWSRETLGIPCFSSLEEAAAKTRADAVLVVTNPGQHKPVILEALRLKKHVLVEKPMVTSVLEADEIAAAAEHSGVNVMAAQGYRFLRAASFIRDRWWPDCAKQKSIIRCLALGARRSLLHGAAEGPADPFRAEAADRQRSITAVRQLSQGGLQASGDSLPVRFACAGEHRLE